MSRLENLLAASRFECGAARQETAAALQAGAEQAQQAEERVKRAEAEAAHWRAEAGRARAAHQEEVRARDKEAARLRAALLTPATTDQQMAQQLMQKQDQLETATAQRNTARHQVQNTNTILYVKIIL